MPFTCDSCPDIDVKRGYDGSAALIYREIMADLLKRRRKLAAVRLQVMAAPQEVARILCNPSGTEPQAGVCEQPSGSEFRIN